MAQCERIERAIHTSKFGHADSWMSRRLTCLYVSWEPHGAVPS